MKKFIMGLIVGVAVATTASVYAEDTVEKVEAYLRPSLPITLDGKEVKLDNAPVMYDGSTYLKLRDVAKITGMGVDWNQETQAVELQSVQSAGGEVAVSSATTQDFVETTFQGIEAVTLGQETFYNAKALDDKLYKAGFRDAHTWKYTESSKTITILNKEGKELHTLSMNDQSQIAIYKGQTHINVKYYPE